MNRLPLPARIAAVTLLAIAALVSSSSPSVGASSRGADTRDPAQAAAGWLARQLTGDDEDHFVFAGGDFPDVGLTIDAVFAFDAAGVAGDAAARATSFIQTSASGYVGFGDERYPGSYAKLLLLAEAQEVAPTSFGGLDLVAGLTALECGATRTECAATPGRYANKTGATTYDAAADFSSPLTQALAILALERTAAGEPSEAALTYLVGEDCADGGYPGSFAASRGGAACVSDLDVTAYVIQALVAAGRTADAQSALTWLAGRQHGDGSFAGTGPTAKPNANSTAVAAQALRVAGDLASADKAVDYLLSLQAGCDAPAADRGRIAYDEAGSGDPARATAQAVLALSGTALVDVSVAGIDAAAPTLTCAKQDATSAAPKDEDLTRGGTILADTGASAGPLAVGVLLAMLGLTLLVLTRRPRRR